MERCKRCILPRNYRAVKFDAEGVCNLCCTHSPATMARERVDLESRGRRLAAIVGSVRAEKGRYDCIVPVSGGQDSTYVAWLMRRRFGLRVLGFNYDNGYRSPLALRNLEQIAGNLGIDIVIAKPRPDLMRRLFAHLFRQSGYFCTVCDAVGYLVLGSFVVQETRLRGSKPLVVLGWSKKYEYQPGLSVLSMRGFEEILRRDPDLHNELRGNPLLNPQVFDELTATGDVRQMTSPQPENGAPDAPGLRMIQLPEYLDWDYRIIRPIIEREVGWQKQTGRHDAHFDCLLAPIQEYLKNRKFGFSQETIKNSVLVREGRMTREEALKRIDMEQTEEPSIFPEILQQWGMKREDVAWDADWSSREVGNEAARVLG